MDDKNDKKSMAEGENISGRLNKLDVFEYS